MVGRRQQKKGAAGAGLERASEGGVLLLFTSRLAPGGRRRHPVASCLGPCPATNGLPLLPCPQPTPPPLHLPPPNTHTHTRAHTRTPCPSALTAGSSGSRCTTSAALDVLPPSSRRGSVDSRRCEVTAASPQPAAAPRRVDRGWLRRPSSLLALSEGPGRRRLLGQSTRGFK